jgi:hypothetical protein
MLRKTVLLWVGVILLGFGVLSLDAAPPAWCRDCESDYNACVASCDPPVFQECMDRCGVGLDACLGQICEDEG